MTQEEILSIIKNSKTELESRYHILKIGIFGSVARNDIKQSSDIDIVVVLESPALFDLIGIKQELEEKIGKSVDIVELRKNMNQFLRQRIEKEVIYV
jgi:hypothetical protein